MKKTCVSKKKAILNGVYAHSKDLVDRDIHGELIIIPIISDVGGAEGEIFSLNKTGRAVWGRLDGKKTLQKIAKELSQVFEGDIKKIEQDILGITQELLNRKMIVELTRHS